MASPERPAELDQVLESPSPSPPRAELSSSRKRKREDMSYKCLTPEYDPWLFTEEEVRESPSRLDGVSEEIEKSVLAKSARFMLEVGQEMMIPSLTVSVAVTFFQRFYMLESILVHSPPLISSACLFLACKVQETHKRLKDIIYSCVKTRTKGSADYPDGLELYEDSSGYYEEKMQLLDKEREILKVLNFDLSVEHPFKALWSLSKTFLNHDDISKSITQAAWNFVNDSYETYVHVRFDPKEIASAGFFLAAKLHSFKLPNGRELNARGERIRGWHELFGTSLTHVEAIADSMMDIYVMKSESAKQLINGNNNEEASEEGGIAPEAGNIRESPVTPEHVKDEDEAEPAQRAENDSDSSS